MLIAFWFSVKFPEKGEDISNRRFKEDKFQSLLKERERRRRRRGSGSCRRRRRRRRRRKGGEQVIAVPRTRGESRVRSRSKGGNRMKEKRKGGEKGVKLTEGKTKKHLKTHDRPGLLSMGNSGKKQNY